MDTRSIAAVWESRLTSASCPDLGMGELQARLVVRSSTGEGLAADDGLGTDEPEHAASIRTRARPAPLMGDQTVA